MSANLKRVLSGFAIGLACAIGVPEQPQSLVMTLLLILALILYTDA